MFKKVLIVLGLFLVGGLVAVGGFSLHKRKALTDVVGTTLMSDAHHVRVVECGKLVLEAEYNYTVITRAAEYMGSLGSNTGTYMAIARLASEADHEVPELGQVLDLAVLKQSESSSIVELGRAAVAINGDIERSSWQARYADMLSTAEYPDLSTALADMKVD